MSEYCLKLHLLSDATFGRGDGVAGIVDQEVEQDAYGFPFLRGRTLKGLLREECDNLVANLPARQTHWWHVASKLFGTPGSDLSGIARMQIGDALLPATLRQTVAAQIQQEQRNPPINRKPLTPVAVLESLTTLRRQTAIDAVTGSADEHTLRTYRVILRSPDHSQSLEFTADLDLQVSDQDLPDCLALLAAGALALRRVGSGRNRGRGHIRCTLWQDSTDITLQCCDRLFAEVSA